MLALGDSEVSKAGHLPSSGFHTVRAGMKKQEGRPPPQLGDAIFAGSGNIKEKA